MVYAATKRRPQKGHLQIGSVNLHMSFFKSLLQEKVLRLSRASADVARRTLDQP